jgi:hypothetical protein
MKSARYGIMAGTILALAMAAAGGAAETVATAVYAKIGNGYQRAVAKDGTFKPEYYALSNGGRIYGTTRDLTVDRVAYPEVAEIAARLLAQQNYHYAQTKEQASLLIVLQWGNTIAFDRASYDLNVNQASSVYAELSSMFGAQGMGSMEKGGSVGGSNANGSPSRDDIDPSAPERFEQAILKLLMDNRVRDRLNEQNARILGYLDDLNESNDIRRWAGGGDRFTDLVGDVEESRYYIVISAYDFPELAKQNKKKLLWQTRVSVRTPGNSFDDSVAAMLTSASKYFGQDSGRLIRGEESKGTVELGDLKFLGEAKEPKPAPTKDNQ